MRLSLILGFVFLVGCNPLNTLSKEEKKEYRQKKRCERRYNKYERVCPENIRIDTVLLPIETTIDSFNVEKVFEVYTDSMLIDSIKREYEAIIMGLNLDSDSLSGILLSGLDRSLLRLVEKGKCIKDTLYFDTTVVISINGRGYNLQIKTFLTQIKNKIISGIRIPEQNFKTDVIFVDKKLVKPSFSIREKIAKSGRKLMFGLIVVVIISIIIYATVKAFRRFLP